jgi:pimeloyl-ACP methyl ester carboxylesterase
VRFVLAPSPLLGPASLEPLAEGLRSLGHEADVAQLPALLSIEGDYYPALAAAVGAALDGAVLVTHSGGGALAPSVVEAAGGRCAGAVLVDAILPHPGRSWLDTAPPALRTQLEAGAQQGLLPAWDGWWPPGALERLIPDEALRLKVISELEPLPLAFLQEAAPQAAELGRTGYVRLSGAYDNEARVAGRLGWPVVQLPLHHLATVTHGPAVAAAVEGLSRQLAAA